MTAKYAMPFDGSRASGASRKAKKSAKKKAGVAANTGTGEQPFNGLLTLSAAAADERFEACMTNPGNPTAALMRWDTFLRRYKSQ